MVYLDEKDVIRHRLVKHIIKAYSLDAEQEEQERKQEKAVKKTRSSN